MLLLPKELLSLMLLFAPLFSKRIWHRVLVLVVGAILAPGRRTVSAILLVMGLHEQPQLMLENCYTICHSSSYRIGLFGSKKVFHE